MKLLLLPLVVCLAACVGVNSNPPPREMGPRYDTSSSYRDPVLPPTYNFDSAQKVAVPPTKPPSARPEWQVGAPLMQGFFGVSFYDKIEREGGSTADVDGDEGDLDQLPLIGGGAQWKLGGENTDFGLEGFFSLEGRGNAEAFVVGSGGAAVAVDVDLLIVDFYGGPFVSRFVGDKMRVYAGAGPLMQFADYDQDFGNAHDQGSGFGVGWYARAGFEFAIGGGTLIGLGALWSDSSIDLDGGLGDLNVEGTQVVLTVSRGI